MNTTGLKVRCIDASSYSKQLKEDQVYEIERGNQNYVSLKGVNGVWKISRFVWEN